MIAKKFLIIYTLLFFLIGCTVEKFVPPEDGYLDISAINQNDDEVVGASIYLNGLERPERTPAILNVIPDLEHEVIIRSFGFLDNTTLVEVSSGDTSNIVSRLDAIPPDMVGTLSFTSQPAGARLLVNGKTFLSGGTPVTAPDSVELPWGKYHVSAQLEGHATISPLLPLIRVIPNETVDIDFILEPREFSKLVGDLPFQFELENVDGDSIRLADLTGYVVLINFWYADCVPCMLEFPGIDSVYQEYSPEGFRVLALNWMHHDDVERVLGVRENLGLTFQLLLDWDQQVTGPMYQVRRFPTNIIVDRTGAIYSLHYELSQYELREVIEPLLAAR